MGERDVVVTGGSPWGMRLTGGKDFGSPLMVSKVSRQVVEWRVVDPVVIEAHRVLFLLNLVVFCTSQVAFLLSSSSCAGLRAYGLAVE